MQYITWDNYCVFQDLSSLPPITDFENFDELFKLPADLLEESAMFCDGTAFTKPDIFKIPNKPSVQNHLDSPEDAFNDEGYYSTPPASPQNIWELVSKLKYSSRRNWESYGHPEPEKERPFLSELGDLSSLWVENLESLYLMKLFKDGSAYNSRMVPRKFFIRDLKYLLGKLVKTLWYRHFQYN